VESLLNALSRMADGVLLVDQDQQITFWNQAAEEILGYSSRDVLGQSCYKILKGYDDQGQLICRNSCRIAKASFREGGVSNFDISVRTKWDDVRWVNVSTFTLHFDELGSDSVLVHLFRDVTQKKKSEWLIEQIYAQARQLQGEKPFQDSSPSPEEPRRAEPTEREREVLILLARGLNTQDIAEVLTISPATVRNHIRNILRKLNVHSRLEAVLYAIDHGLVKNGD